MTSYADVTAEQLRPHGLNVLPQLFAASVRGAQLPPLGWRRHLLLALILTPPLALTAALGYGSNMSFPGYPNNGAHILIEGFCALMSLVVFYVLHQEYISTGIRCLRMMAFAFLILGILDGVHALSPPYSELFVWFRSAAAFISGAMLALALSMSGRCRRIADKDTAKANVEAALVGAATLVFAGLSFVFRDDLPLMLEGARFSILALIEKGLAGLFYLISGIVFLHYYRRSRENILFVLAVAMFLLVESQWLSFFSDPWDMIWWTWHWIRTAVFIGILFGIAHQVVQSAKDLQMSHMWLVEKEKLASLGEMAASIAHEIRNPLGTLTSSVGLLGDARLSGAERSELIGIVEREVNRLNHVVSDTLMFAHPRAGQLHPLNLETVVRDAVKLQAVRFPAIEVDIRFESDFPLIRGNEIQLQQVIWNLFDNAAAAMGGKGRFTILGCRDGNFLTLELRDTGPGIAPENLTEILKPFFTTKASGVGLGLPITQRMVLEHEGTMSIDSEAGKGTCVRLSFPLIARQMP
ncbi:MAG: hypothetical protein LBE33_00600 [Zoogloeaceae bacterium]|nr:hypothetical protein [Zoogloeaceae bacterium]